MQGWKDFGTLTTIVTDQGSPTDGDLEALKLLPGKANETFGRTEDLVSDGSTLRATIYIKFSQRDTYLNENPIHDFFEIYDNNSATKIGGLYYEGVDVNNNRVGFVDRLGVRTVLDTGPFVANIWYRFDLVWKHLASIAPGLFRNGVFQSSTGFRDVFSTSGPVQYKVAGQIISTPGPGGDTYVPFIAHSIGLPGLVAMQQVQYRHFRVFGYVGVAMVCDEAGSVPGDDLFSGAAENFTDNATTVAGYRPPGIGSPRGGCLVSDRNSPLSGPSGAFAGAAVGFAAKFNYWHDMSTKGSGDLDPWVLYGKVDNDLGTFVVGEFNVPRAPNVKTQVLVLPGDAKFPDVDDFALMGLLHKANTVSTFFMEEMMMTYLVEYPTPPLVQVHVLGDAQVLGDVEAASA